MDDDTSEAAHAQQQLEERQRWEAHIDSLRDFHQWQEEMDVQWDRICDLKGHLK